MFQLRDNVVWGNPNFSPFQKFIFYKHYSRLLDGKQETWYDTCLRVIEGMVSIRKTHYQLHGLPWDEEKWQKLGTQMLRALYMLRWSPPGRGMWAMGTTAVEKLGSSPLVNCAYTEIGDDGWVEDLAWMMDMLMCGAGVGFSPLGSSLELKDRGTSDRRYVVQDSREGWVESVVEQFNCWLYGDPRPAWDYSEVRPKGSPIRTFGGTASGPGPLMELHSRIDRQCSAFVQGRITLLQLFTDLANMIGCCVVSGNVRRGAEIGISGEPEFFGFKDRGALKASTIVGDDGNVHEKLVFHLRDWLKNEDLFD